MSVLALIFLNILCLIFLCHLQSPNGEGFEALSEDDRVVEVLVFGLVSFLKVDMKLKFYLLNSCY